MWNRKKHEQKSNRVPDGLQGDNAAPADRLQKSNAGAAAPASPQKGNAGAEAPEARLIGSSLYTERFRAEPDPRTRALLPLRQCEAYVDEEEMLQLPLLVPSPEEAMPPENATESEEATPPKEATAPRYAFDPELAPHSSWLQLYAKAVVEAYRRGLSLELAEDYARQYGTERAQMAEELRMIHQFRMYLDRQNLRYIRSHYGAGTPEMTDLDRLRAYEQDLRQQGGRGLYYDEPSRYHNKLHRKEIFQVQVNDKIETWDRHSEFIVDSRSGRFVTQWDVLREIEDPGGRRKIVLPFYVREDAEAQRRILNSESFNYAGGNTHRTFDVLPAAAEVQRSLDYRYKQELKSSVSWRDVSKTAYRETIREKSYKAK